MPEVGDWATEAASYDRGVAQPDASQPPSDWAPQDGGSNW